jgi:TPR repeat protein
MNKDVNIMFFNRLLLAGALLLSTSVPALCSDTNPEESTRRKSTRKSVPVIKTAAPKNPAALLAKKKVRAKASGTAKAPAAKKAPGRKRAERASEQDVIISPAVDYVVTVLPEEAPPVPKKNRWINQWNSTNPVTQPAAPQDEFKMPKHSFSTEFSNNSLRNLLEVEETDTQLEQQKTPQQQKRLRTSMDEAEPASVAEAENPSALKAVKPLNAHEEDSNPYEVTKDITDAQVAKLAKLLKGCDYKALASLVEAANKYQCVSAQFEVALHYYTEKNHGRASKWLQPAIEKGHSGAMNLQGVIQIASKDYDAASISFLSAININNQPDALFNMGYLHHKGFIGHNKDLKKAVRYYDKASQHGHMLASFELAKFKLRETAKNIIFAEGVLLLEKVAKSYDVKSGQEIEAKNTARKMLPDYQYQLGLNYLNGTGGAEINMDQAVYWLKKSAGRNAQAMFELGRLYLQGDEKVRNTKAAVAYLEQAKISKVEGAEELFHKADFELNGDPFDAADKLLKAARTRNDYDKVIVTYATKHKGSLAETAKQKIAEVHYLLAKMYASGANEHIPQDLQQSLQLHLEAATMGHQKAIETIAQAFFEAARRQLEFEPRGAIYALEQIAKYGYAQAHDILANIYALGQYGAPKDLHKAIEHCRVAAMSLDQAKELLHDLHCELADTYLMGNIKQMQKAVNLLEAGASADHVRSKEKQSDVIMRLAKRFWFSDDQYPAREQAIFTLERIAKQSPEANRTLITYLDELSQMYLYGTSGIELDKEKAIQCIEKAIHLGATHLSQPLVKARVELAECYLSGLHGYKRDIPRCFHLLKDDPQEHPEVRHMLGKAKYNVAVHKIDLYKANPNALKAQQLCSNAAKLLLESADLGYAKGNYALGLYHYRGAYGFTKSTPLALEYLNRAADAGYKKAQEKAALINPSHGTSFRNFDIEEDK